MQRAQELSRTYGERYLTFKSEMISVLKTSAPEVSHKRNRNCTLCEQKANIGYCEAFSEVSSLC